jgi:hypothetical protein
VEEEVRDAGEEANGRDALLFGFFEERPEEFAPGALALGFGFDDDGANLGKVRPIEMKRSAAEEDAGFGFSDGEIANVFADFSVAAAEEGAVAGEGVDEVKDIHRVREPGFTHHRSTFAQTR